MEEKNMKTEANCQISHMERLTGSDKVRENLLWELRRSGAALQEEEMKEEENEDSERL